MEKFNAEIKKAMRALEGCASYVADNQNVEEYLIETYGDNDLIHLVLDYIEDCYK